MKRKLNKYSYQWYEGSVEKSCSSSSCKCTDENPTSFKRSRLILWGFPLFSCPIIWRYACYVRDRWIAQLNQCFLRTSTGWCSQGKRSYRIRLQCLNGLAFLSLKWTVIGGWWNWIVSIQKHYWDLVSMELSSMFRRMFAVFIGSFIASILKAITFFYKSRSMLRNHNRFVFSLIIFIHRFVISVCFPGPIK